TDSQHTTARTREQYRRKRGDQCLLAVAVVHGEPDLPDAGRILPAGRRPGALARSQQRHDEDDRAPGTGHRHIFSGRFCHQAVRLAAGGAAQWLASAVAVYWRRRALHRLFVSLMFVLVSCAIPSGCFSGRMKFSAYLLFAALYIGVIYPIFAYILWNGPLARLGVQDYAGSLGVHAVGGIIGLIGAAYLGKRKTPGQ